MNAFVDRTIEPLMLQLGEWSVRWAVLIVLIAGWIVMVRPRNARLRYELCLAVLVLGLLLPVLPRWGQGITESRAVEAVAITGHDVAFQSSETLPMLDPDRETEVAAAPMLPVQPHEVPDTIAPRESMGVYRIVLFSLTGVWLAGVTYGLLRWLTGVWYLNRLRRTARAVDGACASLFAACHCEAGLNRRVFLRVHAQLDSPVALGPWRPTILVPATWFDQPESLVRASLLHELAHLSRCDDWLALLFQSVRCLMFFHPGVRWLLARLECEREIICDEIALAHDVDAQSYASLLLQLAGRPGRLLPPALPFGPRRTIKARIYHILECPVNKSYWSTVTARVVGMVVLACALVAGGWTWRTPEEVEPGILNADAGESLGHDKPSVPSKPKVPKEELRYGEKSFDQWRHTLEVDLSPDVRQKAFEALCVFGLNGYGKEAVNAILDRGREYGVYSVIGDERGVARSASAALGRLGDLAIPELLAELKSGSYSGRRLAIYTLRWGYQSPDSPLRRNNAVVGAYYPVAGAPFSGANGAWRQGGIEAMDDGIAASGTRSGRSGKVGAGKNKGSSGPPARADKSFASPDTARAKEILAAVLEATYSKDTLVRFDSVAILTQMGPQASSAVPRLVELFSDYMRPTKTAAVEAVAHIGGDPKVVIAGLEKLLAEDSMPDSQSYYPVIPIIEQMGQSAQPLVPTLVAQYHKTPVSPKKMTIVQALLMLDVDKAQMDPIIRDFLPLLFGKERGKLPRTNEMQQSIFDYAARNNIPTGFAGRP